MMTLLENEKEACKRLLYEHITHDLTSHVGSRQA